MTLLHDLVTPPVGVMRKAASRYIKTEIQTQYPFYGHFNSIWQNKYIQDDGKQFNSRIVYKMDNQIQDNE